MSSQEKLQLTEEAVMMHGLSGVHSEVAKLLWANKHGQLLHPFVEARLNEILVCLFVCLCLTTHQPIRVISV